MGLRGKLNFGSKKNVGQGYCESNQERNVNQTEYLPGES